MIKRFIRWLTKPIRRLYHAGIAFRELVILFIIVGVIVSGIYAFMRGEWVQFAFVLIVLATILYSDLEVNDNESSKGT